MRLPGWIIIAVLLSVSCRNGGDDVPAWQDPLPEVISENVVTEPLPPFTEGEFPCSDCHDPELPVNTRRRPLRRAHQQVVLQHDRGEMWCWDCHDVEDRDQLHLASGALSPYEKSPLLCGQCHGRQLRDWRAGAHGKRTGSWNGTKSALLCASCHNAHSPRFLPVKPEPPPRNPRRIR